MIKEVTTTTTKIRSRGEQIIALFQKEACRSITFWELISQLLTDKCVSNPFSDFYIDT